MENNEAVITNMLGYEIYMMATEHLAKMIEYPAYDDWGNVEDELRRAKHIRKCMEYKFPALLDSDTKKHCDKILERAETFYKKRCEIEREMLNRRLEYGKITMEDVKGE